MRQSFVRTFQSASVVGGFKESGLGREQGLDALHGYTEVKSVWIDTGNEVKFTYG